MFYKKRTLSLLTLFALLAGGLFAQAPFAYWKFDNTSNYRDNVYSPSTSCISPTKKSFEMRAFMDGAQKLSSGGTYSYPTQSTVRHSSAPGVTGSPLTGGFINSNRMVNLAANPWYQFGYQDVAGQTDDLNDEFQTWSTGNGEEFTFEFWFRTHGNVNEITMLEWKGPEIRFILTPMMMEFKVQVDQDANGSSASPTILKDTVLLNQLDRKSFSYYTDGEWHQIVLRYIKERTSPVITNQLSIFVDGYTGPDFQKSFTNTTSGAPAMPLYFTPNTTSSILFSDKPKPFKRFDGDLDEIAIWNVGLTDDQILTHYLEMRCAEQNAAAYGYTCGTGSSNTSLACSGGGTANFNPPTFTNPTGYNPDQFPSGYPSNVSVPIWEQMEEYPGARYQPDHSLKPNIPFFGAPQRLGNHNTSNQVVNTQATAENAARLHIELANQYNYALPFQSNHISDTWLNSNNRMIHHIANYVNAGGTNLPRAIISYWRQLDPGDVLNWNGSTNLPSYFDAEDFWGSQYNTQADVQATLCFQGINTYTFAPNTDAYIDRRDLPPYLDPITGLNVSPYYMDCHTGGCGEHQGNPTNRWSYAGPTKYANEDGKTLAGSIYILQNHLTDPRIDFIAENGEEQPKCFTSNEQGIIDQMSALGLAPGSANDELTYWSGRKLAFRQEFMSPSVSDPSSPTANQNTVTPHVTWYDNDGHSAGYPTLRALNEDPVTGNVYPTSYMYPQRPSRWWNTVTVFTGLDHVSEARNEELTSAIPDHLMAPFVSPGINDGIAYSVEDQNMLRPGQWLGLMKLLGGMGAEYYHTFIANIWTSNLPQHPEWYGWQAVSPAYAQGITSRYENILRNSTLQEGDRHLFTGPLTQVNYLFWAGDPNYPVVVRQHNTNQDLFVVSGAIETTVDASVGENTPRTDLVTIDLNAQQGTQARPLTFEIRRQGSVYVYDNSNYTSATGRTRDNLFYQLDKWHQVEHPQHWTEDFWFEAEVWDGNIASGGILFERWTDQLNGTSGGDFSDYETYLTIEAQNTACYENSGPATTYNVEIRNDQTQGTLYAFVRARNKDTGNGPAAPATGFQLNLGSNVARMECITSTQFQWYRVELAAGGAVPFSGLTRGTHTCTLTALNTELEVDQILLSTDDARSDITYQTLACSQVTPSFNVNQISSNPYVVEFTNTSTGGGSTPTIHWDFGDGNSQTTTSTSVTHTYATFGSYTVVMTVNGTHCTTQNIGVAQKTVPQEDALEINQAIEIHPNPTSGQFQMKLPEQFEGQVICHLISTTGQRLREWQISGAGNHTFDLESLPAGLYYLKLSGADFQETRKIVLQRQ